MKSDKEKSPSEALGYIAGAGIGMTQKAVHGKSLSASIIVLAGAILLLGGSFIQHSDTKLFVQFVGCLIGAIELVGWFLSLSE